MREVKWIENKLQEVNSGIDSADVLKRKIRMLLYECWEQSRRNTSIYSELPRPVRDMSYCRKQNRNVYSCGHHECQ
jgi:hypothetical protein